MPSVSPILRHWLTLCIAMVAIMVVIGGATRLTESGLSIVKWELVSGVLPPLSTDAWQKEFSAYKTSPQYKHVNSSFGLSDFQRIYWLEYLHRLVGRTTALIFLLPLIYLAARKQMGRRLMKRMSVAFVLIALQGTVGWIMVQSGLVNEPRVSPIKLALHLALAFTLFGFLLWTRWEMDPAPRASISRNVARAAKALLALIGLQIILGALVAGSRAGLTYNTWPLMDGRLIPHGLYLLTPWWRNHLESVLTIQFQHRMLALAVAVGSVALASYAWKRVAKGNRWVLILLLGVVFLQFLLGVATLLTGVNLWLASLHQLTALILSGIALYLIFINSKRTEYITR